MVQLSDDCFVNDGGLLPLDDAVDLLRARLVGVTGTEEVSLSGADGRVLAAPLVSERNVPPHPNAAVDGYAVYYDDLNRTGETSLPVTGRIAAGHPLDRPARRGEALQVFTGCPMPGGIDAAGHDDNGPDTIFMSEDCHVAGGHVRLPPGIARGANRRDRGEDIQAGNTVLEAGKRMDPVAIGLAASVGAARVAVRRRLRVGLFSTGDEVRDLGATLPPGAIYDANRYAVSALLTRLGCAVTDFGILPDRSDALTKAFGGAGTDHDLLISSGGVSVGEEDHVKSSLESLGGLDFWRLAIKPGRPLALGFVGPPSSRTPFLALPGNPAAALVTFLLFARPLILLLSGATLPPARPMQALLGFDHKKKQGRREFLRCRLEEQDGAGLVAVKAGRQGAGLLTTMDAADGLVDLPEELTYVEAGAPVRFLPFVSMM